MSSAASRAGREPPKESLSKAVLDTVFLLQKPASTATNSCHEWAPILMLWSAACRAAGEDGQASPFADVAELLALWAKNLTPPNATQLLNTWNDLAVGQTAFLYLPAQVSALTFTHLTGGRVCVRAFIAKIDSQDPFHTATVPTPCHEVVLPKALVFHIDFATHCLNLVSSVVPVPTDKIPAPPQRSGEQIPPSYSYVCESLMAMLAGLAAAHTESPDEPRHSAPPAAGASMPLHAIAAAATLTTGGTLTAESTTAPLATTTTGSLASTATTVTSHTTAQTHAASATAAVAGAVAVTNKAPLQPSKKYRDVSMDCGSGKFLRNPIWFALKSALHATLVNNCADHTAGTLRYKAVVLRLLLALLNESLADPTNPSVDLNTLQQMLAKTSNRIQKLNALVVRQHHGDIDINPDNAPAAACAVIPTAPSPSPQPSSDPAAQPIQPPQPHHDLALSECRLHCLAVVKIAEQMKTVWTNASKAIDAAQRPDLPDALPPLSPSDTLQFEPNKLPPALASFLDFAPRQSQPSAGIFGDTSELDKQAVICTLNDAFQRLSSDRHSLANLIQFEEAVFSCWSVSGGAPLPIACKQFHGYLSNYASWSQAECKDNPLRLSRRLLVGAVLTVLTDIKALSLEPLLKDHPMGTTFEPLDALLLPEARLLSTLTAVQRYGQDRQARCQATLPTPLDRRPSSTCLTSRIASSPRSQLGQAILATQEQMLRKMQDEREQKRSEVRRAIEQCRQLQERARRPHTYKDLVRYNRYGSQYTKNVHDRNCDTCKADNQLARMSCEYYADQFPGDQQEQLLIALDKCDHELASEVRLWRDALLQFNTVFLDLDQQTSQSSKTYCTWSTTISWDTTMKSVVVSDAELNCPRPRHVSVISNPDSFLAPCTGSAVLSGPSIPTAAALEAALRKQLTYLSQSSIKYALDCEQQQSAVLADQHTCPDNMTLPEFVAFGSLRRGVTLQWPNILAALEQHELPFMLPASGHLLCQAGWQAEARETLAEDAGAHESTGRLAHRYLQDDNFITALASALERSLAVFAANWKYKWGLCSIVVLTNMALDVYRSCYTAQPLLVCKLHAVLASCRDSLAEWLKQLAQLRDELAGNPIDMASTSLSSKQLHANMGTIAMTGLLTFFNLRATEIEPNLSRTALSHWLTFITTKYDCLTLASVPLEPHARFLATFVDHFLVDRLDTLRALLRLDREAAWPCVRDLITKLYSPDPIGQPNITAPLCSRIACGKAVVTIDVITGKFLIDGLPKGKLSEEVVKDALFKQHFAGQLFSALPYAGPAGPGQVTGSIGQDGSDGQYVFTPRPDKQHLYVFHQHPDGRRHVLVPSVVLEELGFPCHFADMPVWLNLESKAFLFYPASSRGQPPSAVAPLFVMQQATGVLSKVGGEADVEQRLVAASSQFGGAVRRVFGVFESTVRIEIWQCTSAAGASGAERERDSHARKPSSDPSAAAAVSTLVVLPRHGLQFKLDNSVPAVRFESLDFPTFVVDPEQSIGTLVGLQRALVLVAAKGLLCEERRLLVPNGPVQCCPALSSKGVATILHHVTGIDLKALSTRSSHFVYTLQDLTQRLVPPSNLDAWLYLGLLHASTSSVLPDSFTGLTGTEAAMMIAQSAACSSLDELQSSSLDILAQLSALSPTRSLVESKTGHILSSSQTVAWPEHVPSLCALDAYVMVVKQKLEDNAKLHFLRKKADGQPNEPVTTLTHARAHVIVRSADQRDGSSGAQGKPLLYSHATLWWRQMLPVLVRSNLSPSLAPWATYPIQQPELYDRAQSMARFMLHHQRGNDDQASHDFTVGDKALQFLNGINEFQSDDVDLSPESARVWRAVKLPFGTMGIHSQLNQLSPEADSPNNTPGMLRACLFLTFQAYLVRHNENQPFSDLLLCAWAAETPIVPPLCRSFAVSGTSKVSDAIYSADDGYDWAIAQATSVDSYCRQCGVVPPVEPSNWFSSVEDAKAASANYELELEQYNARYAEAKLDYQKLRDLLEPSLREYMTAVASIAEKIREKLPYGKTLSDPASAFTRRQFPNEKAVRAIFNVKAWMDTVDQHLTLANLQCIRELYVHALGKQACIVRDAAHRHDAAAASILVADGYSTLSFATLLPTTVTTTYRVPGPARLCTAVSTRGNAEGDEGSNKHYVSGLRSVTQGWHGLCEALSRDRRVEPGAAALQATGLLRRPVRSVLFRLADQSPSGCRTFSPQAMAGPLTLVDESFDATFRQQLVHQLAAEVCLHREVRLIKLKHFDQLAAFYKELDNTAHEDWDPQARPLWAMFEWEQNCCIRSVQVRVALAMINEGPAPERVNAMMQLDMGEGKTSVIVPIVLLALADGVSLARIVVLTSLLNTNLRLLRFWLGGMLNRRVLCAPFAREVVLEPARVDVLQTVFEQAQRRGDVLMTVREFLLSLELKYFEASTGGNDSKRTEKTDALAVKLGNLLQFLHVNARDVIDEVDEVLHHRFQLVYPLGKPFEIDGGSFRWRLSQLVLFFVQQLSGEFAAKFDGAVATMNADSGRDAALVVDEPSAAAVPDDGAAPNDATADAADYDATVPVQVVQRKFAAFPRMQLLVEHQQAGEAYDWLCERVVSMLMDKSCLPRFLTAESFEFLRWLRGELDPELVRPFLLDDHNDTAFDAEVGDADTERAPEQLELFRKGLLCLRGVLAHDVLQVALRKRFRVEYGLHPNRTRASSEDLARKRRILLAVPYRAKDVAADNTEFGHPDTSLLLTMLSYYWTGLTDENLDQMLLTLSQEPSGHADSIYEQWIEATGLEFPTKFPAGLKKFKGVNLENKIDLVRFIYPLLRFHTSAINYFLDKIVLPRQVKEFEHKILANAWSLVHAGRPRPVTGFSGTSENALLLPLWAKQRNLPELESTDMEVDLTVSHAENDAYFGLPSFCSADAFIKAMVRECPARGFQQPNVVIDAGALILDCTNREFARRWLASRPDCKAVVFFNESNALSVVFKSVPGDKPFELSPYHTALDAQCLAYIDHAHTRGTDLRIPQGTRAAVTLGKGLCRDEFVQACKRMRQLGRGHMRQLGRGHMRQLGRGHMLSFWAPHQVDAQLRTLYKRARPEEVLACDVLQWCRTNSRAAEREAFFPWGVQGINALRSFGAHAATAGGGDGPDSSGDSLSSAAVSAVPPAQIYACRQGDLERMTQTCRLQDRLSLKKLYDGATLPLKVPVTMQRHAESTGLREHPFVRDIVERCLEKAADVERFGRDLDEEQEREFEQEIEDVKNRELPPPQKARPEVFLDELQTLLATGEIDPVMRHLLFVWPQLCALVPSLTRMPAPSSPALLSSPSFWATVEISRGQTLDARFLRPVRWVLGVHDGCGVLTHVIALSPFEAEALMRARPPPGAKWSPRVSLVLFAPPSTTNASPLCMGPWAALGAPLRGPGDVLVDHAAAAAAAASLAAVPGHALALSDSAAAAAAAAVPEADALAAADALRQHTRLLVQLFLFGGGLYCPPTPGEAAVEHGMCLLEDIPSVLQTLDAHGQPVFKFMRQLYTVRDLSEHVRNANVGPTLQS